MILSLFFSLNEEEKRFIENLTNRYSALIGEMISLNISKDSKDFEKILRKIIRKLVRNVNLLQNLDSNSCAAYVFYTSNSIIQKHLNCMKKEKVDNKKAVKNIYGILTENQRDLFLYKYFMDYNNWKISNIMNISFKSVSIELSIVRKIILYYIQERNSNE